MGRVAHKILVSAPVPLELGLTGLELGLWGLGFGTGLDKYLEKRLNLLINAKLFSNNFLEYENMYISDTQRKGVSIMAFVKFCYLNMKLCIMS